MSVMRAFLLHRRALALLVVLAALCMKAVLPAGFMIGADSRTLTIEICDDTQGRTITKQIAVPMKGDADESRTDKAKSECAFSSLSMGALAGADPALLALALAFILLLGFAPVSSLPPARALHLRPPLRGPPAYV